MKEDRKSTEQSYFRVLVAPGNHGHCCHLSHDHIDDDDDCMGVPYARQGHHGKASANILLQIAAVVIIIVNMIMMTIITMTIIGIVSITMVVVIIIMMDGSRQRGEGGGKANIVQIVQT